MDLRALRIALVRKTGRRDLVKTVGADNFVDNGANAYLNEAQRALDRALGESPRGEERFLAKVEPGTFLVKFQDCRVVTSVWVKPEGAQRRRLHPRSLGFLRDEFGEEFEDADRGDPCYYAPASLRLAPELAQFDSSDLEADGIEDGDDLAFGTDADVYRGVVLMPPPESACTVSVFGRFYDRALAADTDVSWWSVHHGEVLVRTAAKLLEVDQRNSAGVRDWELYLESEVRRIDNDTVEQEEALYETNQMDA